MSEKPVIAMVGLGYVGLPLAVAFGKNGYRVLGYDISARRIDELTGGIDSTKEVASPDLAAAHISFSTDPSILKEADVVILAIPTPVDEKNLPDLTLVEKASETVGKNLKKGAIVVYESTVYPGVTEELCGPILEKQSGLKCGSDFTLGYSPERINPGDKEHTVERIVKIVAGQDERTTDTLVALYGSVVKAGIHRASSMKVAEMAKAIENAQRDINIAFVNEIALLCHKLVIPTKDVLAAAKTKWNFLNFQPGLVGGHCIGVDPYYLVEKARQLGMTTQVITAGRGVNDSMGALVANETIAALGGSGKGKTALVLGLTFKEDVPDTRNSKVGDVIATLQAAGVQVEAVDPEVGSEGLRRAGYAEGSMEKTYDAVLFLVPHQAFREKGDALANLVKPRGVFYDLKSLCNPKAFEGKTYLSL